MKWTESIEAVDWLVGKVVARNKCSDTGMHCRSMEEGSDTVSNGVRGVGFVVASLH